MAVSRVPIADLLLVDAVELDAVPGQKQETYLVRYAYKFLRFGYHMVDQASPRDNQRNSIPKRTPATSSELYWHTGSTDTVTSERA